MSPAENSPKRRYVPPGKRSSRAGYREYRKAIQDFLNRLERLSISCPEGRQVLTAPARLELDQRRFDLERRAHELLKECEGADTDTRTALMHVLSFFWRVLDKKNGETTRDWILRFVGRDRRTVFDLVRPQDIELLRSAVVLLEEPAATQDRPRRRSEERPAHIPEPGIGHTQDNSPRTLGEASDWLMTRVGIRSCLDIKGASWAGSKKLRGRLGPPAHSIEGASWYRVGELLRAVKAAAPEGWAEKSKPEGRAIDADVRKLLRPPDWKPGKG